MIEALKGLYAAKVVPYYMREADGHWTRAGAVRHQCPRGDPIDEHDSEPAGARRVSHSFGPGLSSLSDSYDGTDKQGDSKQILRVAEPFRCASKHTRS